jgi:hypothetical protein
LRKVATHTEMSLSRLHFGNPVLKAAGTATTGSANGGDPTIVAALHAKLDGHEFGHRGGVVAISKPRVYVLRIHVTSRFTFRWTWGLLGAARRLSDRRMRAKFR